MLRYTVDKRLVVPETVETEADGDSLELLHSYIELHNSTLETFEWMMERGILSKSGRGTTNWKHTLDDLKTISKALDAGFCPYTPPSTWFSGRLADYLGPIPLQIRKRVEVALPIFGQHNISVHDPRPDRFRQALDPVVVGSVFLQQQKNNFLVGQWDLDQDLRYLESGMEQAKSLRDQIANSLREASDSYSVQPFVIPDHTPSDDTTTITETTTTWALSDDANTTLT